MSAPSLRTTLIAGAALAALALTAAAPPASAEPRTTLRSGAWEAFEGPSDDGTPVCGISTSGRDGRAFAIKYFEGERSLTLHIARDSWSIPDGTPVRVALRFGDAAPWNATATGHQRLIEARLSGADTIRRFMDEFASTPRGRIEFGGDEGAWSINLVGSGPALERMVGCMARLMAAGPGGAQPSTSGGESPASGGATQPFARGAAGEAAGRATQPHAHGQAGPPRGPGAKPSW